MNKSLSVVSRVTPLQLDDSYPNNHVIEVQSISGEISENVKPSNEEIKDKNNNANVDVLTNNDSDKEEVDPFTHELNPTILQRLQIGIMSVTVAPIRIILIFLGLRAIISIYVIIISLQKNNILTSNTVGAF